MEILAWWFNFGMSWECKTPLASWMCGIEEMLEHTLENGKSLPCGKIKAGGLSDLWMQWLPKPAVNGFPDLHNSSSLATTFALLRTAGSPHVLPLRRGSVWESPARMAQPAVTLMSWREESMTVFKNGAHWKHPKKCSAALSQNIRIQQHFFPYFIWQIASQ